MDGSETRRELVRSICLPVREERWLLAGLLGGAAGYVVWLAGTGAAVPQAARAVLGPVSVDSWSTDAAVLAATFAVLWILVPSTVATWFVVGRLTNLRGNIEHAYRLDRPLVLLVPPLALLAVVVGVAVAEGTVSTTPLVVGGAVNAFLLVRTVAYGYRVYAFSAPRLLQALLFLAAVAGCVAAVSHTGSLTGQAALVEVVIDRYGLASFASGEVTRGGLTAPTLPLVGAAAPGVLAIAYVCVQLLASLLVRTRRPEVSRSAIRAGQRYPAVVQPGTSRRLAMGAGGSGGATGDDAGGRSDGAGADAGAASESGASDDPGATSRGDADADEGDCLGQTRVYTPPEDADPESDDAGEARDDRSGADEPRVERSGAGNGADSRRGSGGDGASGADGDDSGTGGATTMKNEFCPVCGETFAADPDRVHCPNCNAVLDTRVADE